MATSKEIFEHRIEYPLPNKPGVKDYIFYCGNLGTFGAEAKKLFDKHWSAHVVKTAATLQDVMLALQTEVTSSGVTQIRELVLVAHGNANQLFFPVVPAGTNVDPVYGCVSAWSLAKLQDDIANQFPSFDQSRKAVVPHLLDDSWVTIRACNIGNSAEAMYALYSFFGGRANVYAPTKYMVFADSPIKPGNRIDSKFGVYDYLLKQHFLSSSEHTPKRQAAIVTDLVDPEFFSQPFQLATAQLTGGDPAEATAYQQLADGLNRYRVRAELKAAFAAAGHPLSTSPQVVSASDTIIDPSTATGPRSVWYVRDTSLPDGAETVDLVYQIRDETDAGGTSTLDASAQLAVASACPSVPSQLFFDQFDEDAFWAVVGRLGGYADQGPYADQRYKDAFDAIQALLDAGTWTDGTNDITAAVNSGLANAGFDPLPDPLPPIQKTADKDTWQIPTTPPLTVAVEMEAAPDGSPLHTIVIRVQLDKQALADQQLGVIISRGRVPHTPGTEIAAYLDRFTADQLASFMDYLRSAYRPAYAYYLDHALAAIERKRDFLTWVTAQPDFTDPLPAHLMLRPNENDDIGKVAFDFDFNDNWREVKQHSKYTATVHTDLFTEEPLTDKLHLTGTYICGTLPPDSLYFSRDELKALESQGFEQYFASSASKTVLPPAAQVDRGCVAFRAALQKWKELRDADTEPVVLKETLEESDPEDPEGESYYKNIQERLEPLHLGLELTDRLFDQKIEPYVKFTEWLAKRVASEALKEALETGAAVGEFAFVFTVPFEMWMHAIEPEVEAVEEADFRGQLLALRLWVYKLDDLTVTQVPFPGSVSIDLPETFEQAWDKVYARDYPYFGDTMGGFRPFRENIEEGFAFAVPKVSEIGLRIVEKADKALSEGIAGLGLPPCHLKALTDIGLLDFDKLRRQTIHRYAIAYLDSWRRI